MFEEETVLVTELSRKKLAMDGHANGQTDTPTDGQKNRLTDGPTDQASQ